MEVSHERICCREFLVIQVKLLWGCERMRCEYLFILKSFFEIDPLGLVGKHVKLILEVRKVDIRGSTSLLASDY